jgi:D-3-phosphoglycerate dehydrogenase
MIGKSVKKKILVLATSFLDDLLTHPKEEGLAKKMLESLTADSNGEIEVEFRTDRDATQKMTAEELEGVSAVIADLEIYDRELLEKVGPKNGGQLGLISRYGIGYSSIDIEAATENGILVTNAPGCNALPTAEWAQATLMSVAGRRVLHQMTAGAGKPKSGPSRLDVSGKTLGVIGTGTIGKNVVKLLCGYEMKVLAYDLYPDQSWALANDVEYVSMDEVFYNADFITLHASASKQIIGEKEIELMGPTTALINCARGILVDNRAVYRAVKENRLWGYGLDEIWMYDDLPLDGLNIIVSSHVGSDTDMGKIGMQIMSTEAVVDFMKNKIPKHVVNKEVLN